MIKKANNNGVASLVLGIVSIVFCWVPIWGLGSGVLGIVFSVNQKKLYPNGIATAGLVTSIIGLVFSCLYSVIYLFFGAMLTL